MTDDTRIHNLSELNKTALRRLNKIAVAGNDTDTDTDGHAGSGRGRFVGTFIANLFSLGFTVNKESINVLYRVPVDSLTAILDAVKETVGANVAHEAMYPNFPAQVAESDEAELLINALVHYVSSSEGKTLLPEYDKLARGEESVDFDVEVTVLGVATESDLEGLAKSLLVSSRPWSDVDKEDLGTLGSYEYVHAALWNNTGLLKAMKVKENVATLLTLIPDVDVSSAIKSVVDALRVAVALSDGDTSLASNTRFKLSRPQRRLVLSLVEKQVPADGIGWTIEKASNEASLHREKFKRLGRAVHHREYAHQCPQASRFFDAVQSGLGRSVYSDVEKAIASGDIDDTYTPGFDIYGLISTLQAYPSIYARRLHEIIRKRGQRSGERNKIVYGFKAVATKVSPTVLIQAWQLFSSADASTLPSKMITLKNGKSVVIPNALMSSGSWDDVLDAIEYGLKRNEHTSGWKKKIVHIVSADDDADDDNNGNTDNVVSNRYSVPIEVRDVSVSDRVIGRGSRVKLSGDGDTIRMFMHWRNLNLVDSYGSFPGVDLDLSATFYSEDFANTTSVWYGALRGGSGSEAMSVHSGDIVDAPSGASEFVDVRIQKALSQGWRYVIPSVFSYSGQKFSVIPDAFAGVMMRNDLGERGEIFDATKVQTKYDLTKDSVVSTPYVFDLKTRELIWLDASVHARQYMAAFVPVVDSDSKETATLRSAINHGGNNVLTQRRALHAAVSTVVNTEYMSAYDYIQHTVGAGRMVQDNEDAVKEYEDAGFDVVTVRLDRAHEIMQFLQSP